MHSPPSPWWQLSAITQAGSTGKHAQLKNGWQSWNCGKSMGTLRVGTPNGEVVSKQLYAVPRRTSTKTSQHQQTQRSECLRLPDIAGILTTCQPPLEVHLLGKCPASIAEISPFSVWIRSFMIEHHSCSSLNQHLHFNGLYPNLCDSANHHDKFRTIQLKQPVTWTVTCTCFTFTTIIPVTAQWVLSFFQSD